MSLVTWIVLGLIGGFIASELVNKSGDGMLLDIFLGVVGAVAGGYLLQDFGLVRVTGINLYNISVAIVGAVVVLLIYHTLIRRRIQDRR
jgi:uncharacterized membrane protein YeaQ/YmgE (transglycosylase-associated protein family)